LTRRAAHPPDLVILDLGLPDMDGVDVIGGLRGWTAVPIIVLSGRADSNDKGSGARRRGRRLRDQAVRHGRAARQDARRRPAHAGRRGTAPGAAR